MAQETQAALHQLLRRQGFAHGRQAAHDVPDAGLGQVAHPVGGKVDAMHQSAAVNPFPAGVPTLHAGRVQQLLPHILHLVKDILEAGLGLRPIANQPERADHRFHRAFNLGKAGLLKGVGMEQNPQHGPDVVAGAEVFRLQHLDGFRILRRSVHPGGNGRLVGDEVAVEMAGQETGRRRLLADDVNDILAVKVAGFPQESLFPVVVILGIVKESGGVAAVGLAGNGVGNRPAGKGPGTLLDIVLGIVKPAVHAHAHGKEFQQFPAIVFVDGPLVAEAVVQVIDHRRIPGDGDQQVPETAHAVAAEHFQFVVGGGVALELAVGGAEDAVPEQRHFLLELAAGVNHPPGKVFRDAADVVAPLDKVAFRQIQLQPVVVLFRVQQFLDGGGVAFSGPDFQVVVRGAETGPPHQVGHQGNILILFCHRAYLLDRGGRVE